MTLDGANAFQVLAFVLAVAAIGTALLYVLMFLLVVLSTMGGDDNEYL